MSNPTPPSIGSIVYNRRGEKGKLVTVIHSLPTRYIISPAVLYYGDQGEENESFEGVVEWDEVFDTPPKAVLHEEIDKLNGQIVYCAF